MIHVGSCQHFQHVSLTQ